MIKTNAGWVINDTGYSNTTAKHIGWCRSYAIGSVNFTRFIANSYNDTENVLRAVDYEILDVQEKKLRLSDRAWKQREILENRLQDLSELKLKLI